MPLYLSTPRSHHASSSIPRYQNCYYSAVKFPGLLTMVRLRRQLINPTRIFNRAASSRANAAARRQKGRTTRRLLLAVTIALPLGLYLTRPGETEQAKSWQVAAYSYLPLRAISRAWGRFNDIELPVWMRAPGFKFYAYMFGANLDEIKEKDLSKYRNLGEFFYRELEPGARPIADSLVVSPSDGKVLQLGRLVENKIEQVKGVTYTLESLLGVSKAAPHHFSGKVEAERMGETSIDRHEEFAKLNGISYSLDDFVGNGAATDNESTEQLGDAAARSATFGQMANADMWLPDLTTDKQLYYAVIYLAPGDYHRFHSPVNWVSQIRRHYVGELFSVAPYFQAKLTNLFCLNERVALLGRWRYGFFSMTPVGATNVGSIEINFDKYLRTNTRWIEQDGARTKAKPATCFEATYESASPLLRGVPLTKGEEMGGFHLGSTVVLVFEAPAQFQFDVAVGDVVKMGQALGSLEN